MMASTMGDGDAPSLGILNRGSSLIGVLRNADIVPMSGFSLGDLRLAAAPCQFDALCSQPPPGFSHTDCIALILISTRRSRNSEDFFADSTNALMNPE
jgi:hypothetical protein